MSSLWNSLRKKARAVNWFGPIPTATAIAGVIILLLWVISGWYGGAPGEIFRGIYIEAGGAVMDTRSSAGPSYGLPGQPPTLG